MALPTLSSLWISCNRALEKQIVRHREQEAHFRRQWDLHSRYFKESGVHSQKQDQWSSRQSYQQSDFVRRAERSPDVLQALAKVQNWLATNKGSASQQ